MGVEGEGERGGQVLEYGIHLVLFLLSLLILDGYVSQYNGMPAKDGFFPALPCIPIVVFMKLEIVNCGTLRNPPITALYPGIPTTSRTSRLGSVGASCKLHCSSQFPSTAEDLSASPP